VKTALNVIWVVLAGFWMWFAYMIAGVLNCITIVGIPLGLQAFKLASYALWPFGRMVINRPNRDVGLGCLGNAIWFVLGGWWLALLHLVTGLLLCITVIGIPLGIASLKLAGLALAPFGKQVVRRESGVTAPPGATIVGV